MIDLRRIALFDDEGAKSLASLWKEVNRHRRKKGMRTSVFYMSTLDCKRFTGDGYNVINNAQLESVLVNSGGGIL